MPPPPATSVTSRLFLGPALRVQSDRRLVSLVRDGYENAFEEIVRRYGKPLDRFAAAIVPSHRAEDVTQDAFSKALLALRHTDKEIELRPWLYRIVRNTALNDLRDQPPPAATLHEGIDGVETPPETAERREEVAELLRRLRALPEPQRAAIVMRELEGLSHEEIAAALGLTGGAARQTIYRARRALRDGFGMLIPVPMLHFLLTSTLGGAAAGAGLGGAATGAAGAGAASVGGAGVGLKAGVASVLVAGSVAGGVALHDSSGNRNSASAADASSRSDGADAAVPQSRPISDSSSGSGGQHGGPGPDPGRGEGEGGDDHGRGGGHGSEGESREDGGSSSGPSRDGDRDDDESDSGPGGGGSEGHSGSGHPGGGSEPEGGGSDGPGGSDEVAPGDEDDSGGESSPPPPELPDD